MDTNLLYGEMAGSWLAHLAIPLGVGVIFAYLPEMSNKSRGFILLGIVVALSFLVQAGLLTSLQAAACKGVKDYGSIFAGASIAAVITAIMAAIPIFFEKPRLAVSQLFGAHKSKLSDNDALVNEIGLVAAQTYLKQSGTSETPVIQAGIALSDQDYQAQELREIKLGVAYWTAFAGAYGIGLGSLIAAKCPAVSTPPRPVVAV